MKTQRLYSCLTLAAMFGFWSCSSSLQTAQNTSETDDLYGNAGNAEVYASNRQSDTYSGQSSNRQQRRSLRNANPDYNDEQQGYNSNTDEYYTELSARKLNRGLSPDPGWNDNGTNAYNSGFVNGYNAASTSAYSWNRWGYNNTGFYNGLGLGLGMSAFGGYSPYSSFGFSFGSPFYSPFSYGSYAYSPFNSPFGYGSGFGGYDPFYSSYAYGYGGYGGYSPFYSPFGYGSYGGYYGSPVYVNNVYVAGADPYRNRTYVRSNSRSAGRYASGFDNSPRAYNPNGGGRVSADNSGTSGSNGYYARPRGESSRGSYYYDNSGSGSGRVSSSATAPSYNSNSGNAYYARPRGESSRGSYTPSNGGFSNGSSSNGYGAGRGSYNQPSYQQSQPSYQQPSYQTQSRGSYTPSPSYSAPSAPSGGGFSGGGGHSGGGGRGPR